jgi:hypothetical protein
MRLGIYGFRLRRGQFLLFYHPCVHNLWKNMLVTFDITVVEFAWRELLEPQQSPT